MMRKLQLYPFLWDVLSILLILIAGSLVSVQLRRQLLIGTTLGTDYAPQPMALFAIIIFCAVAAAVAHQIFFPHPTKRNRFFVVLGAVAVVFLTVALLLPEVSLLQLLYFVVVTLLVSLVAI